MPRRTLHDRLVEALTDLGATPNPGARSTKYTVLSGPFAWHRDPITKEICCCADGDAERLFYVGRGGALRRGRTVAASVPVNDTVRYWLLERAP